MKTKTSETLTKKASLEKQKVRTCPHCHNSLEPQLLSVELQQEGINECGREQLTYLARTSEFLQWLPEEKKYRCLICKGKFTLKELAIQ
jgi:hypothetical protein